MSTFHGPYVTLEKKKGLTIPVNPSVYHGGRGEIRTLNFRRVRPDVAVNHGVLQMT